MSRKSGHRFFRNGHAPTQEQRLNERRHPMVRTMLKWGLVAATIAAAAQLAPAQQPANVRIAIMPVTNFTPVLVARDKGFFAAENLNVTWTTVPQGAIAIEAVFGGSAEVSGGSIFE